MPVLYLSPYPISRKKWKKPARPRVYPRASAPAIFECRPQPRLRRGERGRPAQKPPLWAHHGDEREKPGPEPFSTLRRPSIFWKYRPPLQATRLPPQKTKNRFLGPRLAVLTPAGHSRLPTGGSAGDEGFLTPGFRYEEKRRMSSVLKIIMRRFRLSRKQGETRLAAL